MAFFSEEKTNALVRRTQLELESAENRLTGIERKTPQDDSAAASSSSTDSSTTTTRAPMVNLLRNSDHSFSVDGWFNEAGTGEPPTVISVAINGGTF